MEHPISTFNASEPLLTSKIKKILPDASSDHTPQIFPEDGLLDAPTNATPPQIPADAPTNDDAPSQIPDDAPTNDDAPSQIPADAPTNDAPSQIPADAPTNDDAPSQIPPQTHSIEDDIMNSFLNEVERMPQTPGGIRKKRADVLSLQSTIEQLGNAESECIRLSSQLFNNSFHVLLLSPEASDEDIRLQYRKISLLIHPDKCKHPKAREAFQVLKKAYEDLQKPEMRNRYKSVIAEAKNRVNKAFEKENRIRKARKETLLDVESPQFRQDVIKMCDLILDEQKERREYAERCRAANERYEREQEILLKQEELRKHDEKKKWIEQRDDRIENWREFQENIATHKTKTSAFKGLRNCKETRPFNDKRRSKKTKRR